MNATEDKQQKGSWAHRYLSFLVRHKKPLHIFLALLTAASFFFMARLSLRTDFATLLPDSLPSVVNARELSSRLGGTGLLVVGVVSPNFESNKSFVEALAKGLDPLVGDKLRYFEYRYDDIRDYIFRYGLHYLSLDQLQDFKKKVSQSIEEKKDEGFSSFLGFEEEEEKNASVDDREIVREWISKAFDPSLEKFLEYRDSYLSAENGKVLVLALRPTGSSLGVSKSRKLVAQVRQIVNDLDPSTYHSDMEVTFSGNVQQSIEEYETIQKDIVDTALLLLLLVFTILFLFFWSVKIIFLLVSHLLIAVAVTFAITQLHIGYLNSQTAFLGSLVVGTGINYGIILLSRFLEHYRKGTDSFEAVAVALKQSVVATIVASSTTAIAFGSLFYNENKGLSQFAFIGGLGVALCWTMAFSFLPLWTHLIYKKENGREKVHPVADWATKYSLKIGRWFVRSPLPIGVFFGVISLISIWGFSQLAQDPIEYDFDKVRNKKFIPSEVQNVRRRVNSVFSVNLNPSVVMVDSQAQARELCPAFDRIEASLSPEDDVLDSCLSLYNYFPKRWPRSERKKRVALIKEIKTLTGSPLLRHGEFSDIATGMHEKISTLSPRRHEIPEQLTRRFTELDGRKGLFAYLNPESSRPIQDGRNLLLFTGSLDEIYLPKTKTTVSAAGNSFIFADLLEGIKRDGPKVALIAFFGVLLMSFILCGGIKNSIFICGALTVGALWMMGLQGLIGIKYNFFNFIALPLTFGLGVDYPMNVFVRCRQEGFKNISKVIRGSATAVLLCSMTTIIGYYTLLGAASQALASFAKLALLGEISCLLIAIVGVPWALRVFAGGFKDEESN